MVYTPWGTSLDQSFDITPKDYEFKNFRWFAIAHLNGARADINGPGIMFPGDKGSLEPPRITIVKGSAGGRADLYSLPIDRFKKISFKRVFLEKQGIVTYLIILELRDNYAVDNPGVLTANVQGYYQARNFYKPTNEKEAVKYDYRSTIHWEPNITTDASGNATINFYNTNLNTNTKIMVEGITSTGNPLTGQADYQTTFLP